MSLTNSSSGQVSITYDKYFMMLQNACIRYDKKLKQKSSTTARAVYQHELDDDPSIHDEEDDYLDDSLAPDGIDSPSDDIYNVHNTNFKRTPHVKSLIPRTSPLKSNPTRLNLQNLGIMDLYTSPNNMLSEDIKKEIAKYNRAKEGSIQGYMSQDGQHS